MTTWLQHVSQWRDCQRCPLSQQRGRICLARGSLPASVLLVGEAPGATEDAKGLPFKGPAGALLDQIIDRSIPQGMTYTLTNLVACFPREAKERGDNEPSTKEVLACRPRLVEFINLAQPRLIVRVGGLATRHLDFNDTTSYVDIVHPAYIIRMPLAQQQMATQRCIVQIRNAIEDLPPIKPFIPWKSNHAEAEASEELQRIYDEAASRGERHPDDPIAF